MTQVSVPLLRPEIRDRLIPDGGTTGQVAVKSAGPGAEWADPESVVAGSLDDIVATEEQASDLDENTASNVNLMTPLRVISALKAFEPYDPRWFGCDGSDGAESKASANVAGLNDLFNTVQERSRDYDDLPPGPWPTPTTPVEGRPWYNLIGREVNGQGAVLALNEPVDLKGAFGLNLKNLSLIAVDDGWSSGDAVLINSSTSGTDFAPANTAGMMLENILVNCNGKASGIDLIGGNRWGTIKHCRVFGFGGVDGGVGINVRTGLECELLYNHVYGSDLAYTSPPEATNNAIGINCDQGDCELIGNKVFRSATGVRVGNVSGVLLAHNHLHAFDNSVSRPSIFIDRDSATGHIMVHDNYIDSSVIWVRGPRNVEIIDNRQLCLEISGTPAPAYMIRLIAREPNETLMQFHARGNRAQIPLIPPSPGATAYTPLTLQETGGNSFSGLQFCEVGDWKLMSGTNGGTGTLARTTYGQLEVNVAATDFDGSNDTFIDLTSFLLLPNAPSPATFIVVSATGRSTASGSAVSFPTGWAYDRTTGRLRMRFAAAFDGFITLTYKWAFQDVRAVSASSPPS